MPGFNRDELGRFAVPSENGGGARFAEPFENPSTREAMFKGKDIPAPSHAPAMGQGMPALPSPPKADTPPPGSELPDDLGIGDAMDQVSDGINKARSSSPAEWAPDMSSRLTSATPFPDGGLGLLGEGVPGVI